MITVPTGDLVGILSDVIPFAWQDDDLPMLNVVQLQWVPGGDGDRLVASTTDRFRVARSAWVPGDVGPGEEHQDDLFTKWGGADDSWSVNIGLPDAKELVKVFKLGPKELAVPLTVDYFQDRRQVRFSRNRDTGYTGVSVLVDGRLDEFPDLAVVLASRRFQPAARIGFTARFLADFAKVRPRGPLVLTFCGETQLTQVTIGERFIGAIMPQRLDAAGLPTGIDSID